jgi:hypothetical protein
MLTKLLFSFPGSVLGFLTRIQIHWSCGPVEYGPLWIRSPTWVIILFFDLRPLGGRMGERELSAARGGGGGVRRPEDPLRLDQGGQAGPDTGQGNPRLGQHVSSENSLRARNLFFASGFDPSVVGPYEFCCYILHPLQIMNHVVLRKSVTFLL